MNPLLRNERGHANPISIAINVATIILGLTIVFFNPKFLPVKGIVFFAVCLVIMQIIQVIAFGSNTFGIVLAGIIIISSVVVIKLGLGAESFIIGHWRLIILSLLGLYILRECVD